MAAHSKIGASSMHRWANCPGSVRLSENMPNTSSKYAYEGTRAHELAAALLTDPKSVDGTDYEPEMWDAVTVYVNAIRALKPTWMRVEERFDLSSLHPGLFGTADCVMYFEEEKLLSVWDYKHGQGIAVEVEKNEQLLYYALGALMKTKVPCSHVEMVICQPRCFHPDGPIRKWKIDVIDLLDFAADLVEAAKRTENPNAELVSGDHCRFCPAAPICPTLHATAMESARSDFTPALAYDPSKLADALSKVSSIEAWVKAVKEFAQSEAQRGVDIPGFKLVPKRASRKWKFDEGDVESALLLEYGLSYTEVMNVSMKTPAQIEKLLSKEQKKQFEDLVIKESSGSTLAPISDKRPNALSSVETDFTVINA